MNQNISNEKIYLTDLALSSFLSLHFPLIDLFTENGVRYEFVFKNSSELQKLISDFYSSEAKVTPLTYFNAIKNLKGRIYLQK